MRQRIDEIAELADAYDYERVVVCGVGGSGLAPLAFGRLFGVPLEVLDTTHPAAIRRLSLDGALFVVSSKSGTTLETRCLFDYLWERVGRRPGRFLAVTDPGSALEQLARERSVRSVSGEPTIGGRYSALSAFGLVPAALAGVDVGRVLERAEAMHDACRVADSNPGLELGLALGAGWQEGRDKVVFDAAAGFELWVEQLIAESTGKEGKGLVPAPGESSAGNDRTAIELDLDDPHDVGAEIFRLELAVAVAGALLRVNPFDQPDVEDAKERIRAALSGPGPGTVPVTESLPELLETARAGDYVAIQAFIDPAREAELMPLVERARETGRVVTVGLGPRYLHSTGQLHKGGPPTGIFIQVRDEPGDELAIPGRKFGFRRLIAAQAAGDYDELVARGRRVARVRLEEVSG